MPFIRKSTPSRIHKAKLQRKPTGEQGNYNSAWAKMSRSYRRANPLCECCLVRGIMTDITPGDYKGCVDHMIPITRGGSMYNLSNLLALCKECHDYFPFLKRSAIFLAIALAGSSTGSSGEIVLRGLVLGAVSVPGSAISTSGLRGVSHLLTTPML